MEQPDLIENQAARIAELEAALRDVLPYVDTCNLSHREAQERGYALLANIREEGRKMSDTTTGWPGEPGVPLNPERDGWHWVRSPDAEPVPYHWVPAFEVDLGIWPAQWVYDQNEHWLPSFCTYLGPCLTPDEATARQARIAELEGVLGRWLEADDAGDGHECIHAIASARAALEGKKDE